MAEGATGTQEAVISVWNVVLCGAMHRRECTRMYTCSAHHYGCLFSLSRSKKWWDRCLISFRRTDPISRQTNPSWMHSAQMRSIIASVIVAPINNTRRGKYLDMNNDFSGSVICVQKITHASLKFLSYLPKANSYVCEMYFFVGVKYM